jgi:hypothetical protein
MDDFIAATQLTGSSLDAARSTLFDCIDQVLRPLSPSNSTFRKDLISTKKLLKGDAAWTTRKAILGWTVDTIARTVELPPHRLERLHELLESVPCHQRRTSRLKWQQLLGELRSMVLAIPGGRGLFSQLQSVLLHATNPAPKDRLRLPQAVHDQLDNLRWIASSLRTRPTRWAEIVHSSPTCMGTVDASGLGMGGVWLPTTSKSPPLLWRSPFDRTITNKLVTADNPAGTITNSDLGQLSLACHPDILTSNMDVREQTIRALSDKTAAISRNRRGSTSTNSPAAYLCRMASIHQRAHRYSLITNYLPGPLNVMADDLSRRWDLSDSQLLLYFNSCYPQALPWKLCYLRPAMNSSAMLSLSMRRCNPASLLDAALPLKHTGISGNMAWSPTWPKDPMQSTGCKFSLSEYVQAGFPPPTSLSELTRWQTPSPISVRRTQRPTTATLATYSPLQASTPY